jgi:hypothetical protein
MMGSNRRSVLLLCAGALFAAAPARAQNPGDDTVRFVRDLYAKEIAQHAAKIGKGESEFLAVFTAETQQIWRAAQANRNKANLPVGPILHAFFGWGVLPGHEVKLGAVTRASGDAVAVEFTAQGEPRRVVVSAVREAGRWRIADIDYGRGDGYVAYLRRLARM